MTGEGERVLTYGDQPTGLWSNLSQINQSPSQGNYQYTFTDTYFTDWSQYYKTLNVANVVINSVPDIPWNEFDENQQNGIAEKNEYIGEALLFVLMSISLWFVYGEKFRT